MKVFVAFPFTQLIDKDTGLLSEDMTKKLNSLRDFLMDRGHSVFLAHYREKWGKELMTPDECTKDDYREMKDTDLVIAFPGDPVSSGVHIELGWASALSKRILLMLKKDVIHSPLVYGLGTITKTRIIQYEEFESGIMQDYIAQYLEKELI